MRPLRFGLQLLRADDLVQVVRAAEEVGFASVQVPDHLGRPDPFATLAAAAVATKRLRLGTLVLNNEFWPLAVLARAAVTLDVLSGGRVELGLGAGHMKAEFDAAGLVFHPAGRRVTHLEEDVALLRRLLDGETVTAEGARTSFSGFALEPRPVQERMPLLVGGNGDRVLALAGRIADIAGLTGFSVIDQTGEVDASHFDRAGLEERVAVVRDAAGERCHQVELNLLVQHVEVASSRDEAVELAASGWGDGAFTADQVAASPFVLAGTVSSIGEELLRLRDDVGVSYVTVRALPGSPFDAVVRELAGA